MIAKDLIKLCEADPDREVLLQVDPCEELYSPVVDAHIANFKEADTGKLTVGLPFLKQADIDMGYKESDVLERGRPALILIPR